uniref:NADH-ubiquinone oxidoreductase chain 6 n=1 Tax=Cynoglossus roulei TaxID=1198326 RepID=A0A6G6D9V6_9PLEU|nr:NADH dehydrogenase subunit 6 [Cynoglossus roulei]QIE13327.1 NADH dehydrogenase subunit 6 [Cynoglossus roulei]QNO35774.1 NADH dehydrogenase subunit 6 [Cynoglossus roulei]
MTFIMYIALLVMVVGLGAVVAHPSPYFGSLTLVVVSGAACVVLIVYGGTFLALVMFLVYLGGMLVVFAYTTALAADSFPYTLTYGDVMLYWTLYMGLSLICYVKYVIVGVIESWDLFENREEFGIFESDVRGMALMYFDVGSLLLIGGWMLLLTLIAVLELCRGNSRGALRAV